MAYLPLLILGILHGVVDCYATMIPPLWNPLEAAFSLQGMTGIIIAVVQIPASFGQTVFGMFADRFASRWLTIIGAAMAVLGLGLAGLCTNLFSVAMMLALSAAGVGLFHPEAVTLANRVAGRGRAIGLFLGCGFLGQAIGPVCISYVIDPRQGRTLTDIWRTLPVGITIVAMAAVAMAVIPMGKQAASRPARSNRTEHAPLRRRVLQLLVLMSVTKSMGIMMLLYTLPQFIDDQVTTGWWMSIYMTAQAVGILGGGWIIAERHQRFMLVMSLVASLATIGFLIPTAGMATIELLLLSVYGFSVAWAIPTTIQLGQAIAPGRERMVGGLMIGFSWGTAMLVTAPLAGWIGDTGLPTGVAYAVAALFTVCALACAAALPKQKILELLSQPA